MKDWIKASITVVAFLLAIPGVLLLAEAVDAADRRIAASAVSPTIDPATCAVHILSGYMANPVVLEQIGKNAASYQKMNIEKFAAIDMAKQDLVRDAFGWCTFLQQAADGGE